MVYRAFPSITRYELRDNMAGKSSLLTSVNRLEKSLGEAEKAVDPPQDLTNVYKRRGSKNNFKRAHGIAYPGMQSTTCPPRPPTKP